MDDREKWIDKVLGLRLTEMVVSMTYFNVRYP